MAEKNTSFLSNEDALLKLATDKSIDVVIVVAGQPAKLFAEMKPEARQYIKLLRLHEQAPESQAALATYFPATVRAASYPNWLSEDLPTLTTKAFLVTYDYHGGVPQTMLTDLARSMCRNFAGLQSDGHPKWQEVSLTLPPLGKGWSYYGPTERELLRCKTTVAEASSSVAGTRAGACTRDRKVLGLCKP
jgi:uncharacterized protein